MTRKDNLPLPDGYKPHPVSDGGVGGPKRNDAKGKKVIDVEQARRSLQDTLQSRGSGLGVEEIDILLRFFPLDLLWQYARLLDKCFGERRLGSGRGYDENDLGLGARSKERLTSVAPQYRGGAEKSAGGSSVVPIRSEGAVLMRSKIDRRLRRIGREIKSYLDEREIGRPSPVVRQCSGKCKKFGEAEWLYCPNCGGPMQETV